MFLFNYDVVSWYHHLSCRLLVNYKTKENLSMKKTIDDAKETAALLEWKRRTFDFNRF